MQSAARVRGGCYANRRGRVVQERLACASREREWGLQLVGRVPPRWKRSSWLCCTCVLTWWAGAGAEFRAALHAIQGAHYIPSNCPDQQTWPNHPVVAHTTAAAPSLREEVEVSVDNETSNCHSMMTLRCRDRKGLLYDLFRSLKDIDLR